MVNMMTIYKRSLSQYFFDITLDSPGLRHHANREFPINDKKILLEDHVHVFGVAMSPVGTRSTYEEDSSTAARVAGAGFAELMCSVTPTHPTE